jgi:hypothetical protein
MSPYRRQLLGLPLQRSLFQEICRASEVPGLAGILPGGHRLAWLDDNGDLFLDQSSLARLSAALPAHLTIENLNTLERAHRAACAALLDTTSRAAASAGRLDDTATRELLSELGTRVAALVPYGILTKFVPDALFRTLAAAGDTASPSFPARSAGAALTDAFLGLYLACRAKGYSPEELEAQWPQVRADIAMLLREFCRDQAGFGPLAWDAPGYENHVYVLRALKDAFSNVDADALRQRLARPQPPDPPAVSGSASAIALRRTLAFWLDFLERETWYVRRAFYLGMVPLLRQLVPGYRTRCPEFGPQDLLFLEIQELTTGVLDLGILQARRQKYLADHEYLTRHGINPDGLTAIVEEA